MLNLSRKTEDQHKQKRLESASNLLSELLAEPVPKPTEPKPNLRYGGTVNSRYSTSLAGRKKRANERNKKLPKVPLKGKRDRQVEKSAHTKENVLPKEQDRVDLSFSEDIAGHGRVNIGVRSQNTPRHDFVRTSSPVSTTEYASGTLQGKRVDEDKVEFIKEKQFPDDDFWRSNSPTGAEFVTTKTYRKFKKEEPKRFKAREAAMRKTPPMALGSYGLSRQPQGTSAMGRTFQRTRPTDSLLPGGETLTEIDRLLEDIPDDGSTFDQENLEGIESLLEGDDELRDLLSDVDWRSISKVRVFFLSLSSRFVSRFLSRVTATNMDGHTGYISYHGTRLTVSLTQSHCTSCKVCCHDKCHISCHILSRVCHSSFTSLSCRVCCFTKLNT